jgi:catechol 2,3-dioxygenase-like lactoylglutathione lyase family enzyme
MVGGARVHHLAMRGGLPPVPAMGPAAALDLGEPLHLAPGPNLYLASQPGEAREPRPVAAPGIAHWCVQALDGAAARGGLEAAGAGFLSPPTALGTGFLYAYGHQAAGGLFELETAPFLPAEPPAWFGHVAFVSEDAERLATFYADLLDAPLAPGGRFRDNPRIDTVAGLTGVDLQAWWVRAEDFTLECWRYFAPPAPTVESARWYPHLGLEVDAIEPVLARIAALGGRTGEVAVGSDGRSARAADLDGNALLLIELAEQARGHGVAALPHRDVLTRAAAARGTP